MIFFYQNSTSRITYKLFLWQFKNKCPYILSALHLNGQNSLNFYLKRFKIESKVPREFLI